MRSHTKSAMKHIQIKIGEFRRRRTCRFCASTRLAEVLDLGYVPLAGGFLREDQLSHENLYPLKLYFCQNCYLLQVLAVVPPRKLFSNYFYHSSSIGTLAKHFDEMAKELKITYLRGRHSFAVEVGSNDGVLLRPLRRLGIRCVGIEPAVNLAKTARKGGFKVINDFFSKRVAENVRETYGEADAIIFCNSFAHIDDMDGVMNAVKILLKKEGVLIIEVHYVGALLTEMNYDMVYHEHLNYYSLMTLVTFFNRFGMEIFDVKKIPIHAGSIRCYVRYSGVACEGISRTVHDMLRDEMKSHFDSADTFVEFGIRVDESKLELNSLLQRLKSEGRTIIGYGASGRATTIMSFCGIDLSVLDFVVDDSKAKQGYFTPGSHLPIKSWSDAEKLRPDYVLLFAWSYFDEIMKKRSDYVRKGGRFILPLPRVRVIS